MLSGYLNMYGLAFTLASIAALVWRRRIRLYSPESQIKDLWLKILLFIFLFCFFLGTTGLFENPVWFRTMLVVGHVFMIPAVYYVSAAWWKLLIGEMPKWWGNLVIGLGALYVGSEIYYAFQGYLPISKNITETITVMARNDHPFVAWLFIPTVWSGFWPLGYVFMRQSWQSKELKQKIRLFVFGLSLIFGSSMAVFSNFVTDPARLLSGNIALGLIFLLLIPAALLKPKQTTTSSLPATPSASSM